MRKIYFFLLLLAASYCMQVKADGIPQEILQDGNFKFNKVSNTLIIEDGARFSQSKGLVVFDTGKDLHILLKGNAEFRASLVFKDKLIIDSEVESTLSVTSNISGSAIQASALVINKHVNLQLLSRNSQDGMYALSCPDITVNGGTLVAEVTTAFLAIETDKLTLNGSWLEKPKGGVVDTEKHSVCFGDGSGTPAKRVRITPVK